jgi:hypothetical protein
MYLRITHSFDFSSTSQTLRVGYGKQYCEYLASQDIPEILFGSGTFSNAIIGNGAKNRFLMLLSQIALVELFIWIWPIIHIFARSKLDYSNSQIPF